MVQYSEKIDNNILGPNFVDQSLPGLSIFKLCKLIWLKTSNLMY